MKEQMDTVTRRSFLRNASVALTLPMIGLGALGLTGCAKDNMLIAQPTVNKNSLGSWKTVIVSDKEPGDPLIITGTIYSPDGRTPMEGARLWVYHTDATGHYSPLSESGGDNRNTRLHGVMRTNAEGRYEFRTIRPAAYPGRTNPAHIHAFVSAPDYPEYWIDEYLFEGDSYITGEMRQKAVGTGTFSSILQLTRGSDGVLRGSRDIKIERCSKNCTRS
jgi:protocatechuate 3,4-dioxygenase, beta subunit